MSDATVGTSSPLVSVVVPTRDRARTLSACLATIVSQSYSRVQIVVSDNNSSDDTRAVVDALSDDRITYQRSPTSLSLNDSYGFALDAARGDLVTFIGDDDGFLPGAIDFAVRVLSGSPYSALTWRKVNYMWPDHKVPAVQSLLLADAESLMVEVDGMKKLRLFAAFREAYANLPCIYNSFVHASAIARARASAEDGRLFGGVIPDVHSGIALCPYVGTYLQAWFPLTVNGASSSSGGVLQGMQSRSREEEELVKDILPAALKARYHPDIGESASVVSIAFGEYLIARSRAADIAWPRPRWRRYVKALLREARGSQNPAPILESARHTVRRRKLAIRVPSTAGSRAPVARCRTSIRGQLYVPPGLIPDVAQMSAFLESLIPTDPMVESRPVRYFVRRWLSDSFRTLIEVYRALWSRR